MASLNLDINYFDNIKTMRLVARLGPGSDVLPLRLWAYVAKQCPESGRLALLESELEHICGWWGEKGVMVTAMIEIGFLERGADFYIVHDWLEHSGHLAAFKKRAKKAAQKRWGIKRKSSNATSIASSSPKQCPSSAVPYSTLPTQHAKIKHLDFVWLTPEEFGKLQTSLGKHLNPYLSRLDGYIGQIGEKKAATKYVSHYHVILNWYRKDVNEGIIKPSIVMPIITKTPEPVMTDEEREAGVEFFGQLSKSLVGGAKRIPQ